MKRLEMLLDADDQRKVAMYVGADTAKVIYENGSVDFYRWVESPPRVVRGGSWYNDVRDLRASYRYRNEPGNRLGDLGFRCVASFHQYAEFKGWCRRGWKRDSGG